MTSILIDAYNIARPHGTGVATYGRTLGNAAADLGHDVSLLFGTRAGHAKQPLLNEIAIAEGDEGAPRGRSPGALLRQATMAVQGAFGTRSARHVPLSGDVIMPPSLGEHTAGSDYWNAPRLFSLAHTAFRATGRMSSVEAGGAAVAHWTYPLPLKMPHALNLYTLHDLVPLRLPYTTADKKKHYLALCQSVVREADHILTVSEHSRADIIRMLGVEERRVTNLYQPTDIADLLLDVSIEEIERGIEGLLNLPRRGYYLFFGALEPKKNLARILEAYLTSGARHPLVIVGAPGWGSNRDVALLKQLAELSGKSNIKWLGYLPRRTLATVIAGARAVVFPSLYEGFGLPVLEAMSLGTPAITSNSSSLPEVAGDAGLLVDPLNVRAIAGAIAQLDDDDSAIDTLSAAGLAQAQKFSAARYQSRLASLYTELGVS
jgi:glycosyltransferase involved in cell wall biosynthesis